MEALMAQSVRLLFRGVVGRRVATYQQGDLTPGYHVIGCATLLGALVPEDEGGYPIQDGMEQRYGLAVGDVDVGVSNFSPRTGAVDFAINVPGNFPRDVVVTLTFGNDISFVEYGSLID
jgi:hypothetical protein